MLRDKNVSIYVLVDALGWEILRNRPFLDEILTERARVETILGYSSGAIPTLLTGQPPETHGHWNLFYRSPETSPFRWTRPLARLPQGLREHRVFRRLVKEVSHRVSGYEGYFAIYNLPIDRLRYYDICETADIYQPGGLSPSRSLFDILTAEKIPYRCYDYHRFTDEQILARAPGEILNGNHPVYFLYLSGLDHYLHFHVSDDAGVTGKLRWYEQGLAEIYRAARERCDQPELFVFSDHGMTPIRETRNLMAEIASLPLRIPEDYLPSYDSTMARFWFHSDRAKDQIRGRLDSLDYGRVLSNAELSKLGLGFDDDRYGELVFVMNPSILIAPSDMGRIRFDGMHGFHPIEDPHAYAAFLTTSRQSRGEVSHITDVLPALVRDLRSKGHLEAEAPELALASRD